MANISQVVKTTYIVTSADESAFAANIPVLWEYPFFDTNYVLHASLEIQQSSTANAAFVAVGSVTPAGFTCLTQGQFTAGDILVVHAIASHR